MNLSECLSAVAEAFGLLASFPWRWLLVVVVFLVAVEALMFIPYAGFVIKLAVASVVWAQVIAMFAGAAAGGTPRVTQLLSSFTLPLAAQVVLVASALVPFVAGMLFLHLQGGAAATGFFFGNILKDKPPSAELFVQFKYIMLATSIPFTFVAGAVVIKGLSGWPALSAAFAAALTHWLPVVLMGLLAFAFEWSMAQLATIMPRAVAVPVSIVVLLGDLAFSFAVTYTISARVFGLPAARVAT